MDSRVPIVALAVLVASCAMAPSRGPANMAEWDQIVSSDLFADVAPFSRNVASDGDGRVFSFAVEERPDEMLMSVVIVVGPPGSRLDADAWAAAVAVASDVERARDFPDLGARAQIQAPSFSPEGAFSGVVFTTADGNFDLQVSVFESSSATPRRSLTAIDAARRVDRAYRGRSP
ncbi:MAG: hypothetical protein QNJ40_20125 [Xanthomonadales bacterium]|nr:hypothetical protein [Xanthomonadales bacterium]